MSTSYAFPAWMEGRLRLGLGRNFRKPPSEPCNVLKYHDSAKLLFGLIWSCLAVFGPVWSRLALFGLMRPCLASCAIRIASFSHYGDYGGLGRSLASGERLRRPPLTPPTETAASLSAASPGRHGPSG